MSTAQASSETDAHGGAESGAIQRHPSFGPAMPDLGWVPAPRYLMRRDRVLAQLEDVPPGRLLDIGCGPAVLLAELAERGFSCTGLETSPSALEMARHLHGTAGAVRLTDTPDPDWAGRFDVICAFEVLEHIEDDKAALNQWLDWLAPGGIVLLSMPAHPELWNPYDEYVGHFRRYRQRDMLDLAEACHLHSPEIECYGYPMANIMERIRWRAYRNRAARASRDGVGKDDLTGDSGVNRPIETRAWPYISKGVGRYVISAGIGAQKLFLSRDLGNGYLMKAYKRQ